MILWVGDRLSARRWAAGTRVNGQPFDEARLAPGDCLTIGEVELEIESPQFTAAEFIATPIAHVESPAESQTSNSERAATGGSWGEWNSTRQTVLSAERQNDAVQEWKGVESDASEPQRVGQEPWGRQLDVGEQSNSRLSGLHERLLQLEETVGLWKDARDAWQQEKAEWRTEREQTQRLWTDFQQQLLEVQSRADEIAGRIERLEHSMAAQALVPKFDPPRFEFRPTDPQANPFREVEEAAESTARATSSFDLPIASVVDRADEATSESEDEFAPFAEFSIWRQGAANAGPNADESAYPPNLNESAAAAGAHVSAEPVSTTSEKSPQVAPAKSFIEQYGYMFVDDGSDAEAASGATQNVTSAKSADSDSIVRTPQNLGRIPTEGGEPPTTASDEEESIEQYMSKLLQRVRGDQAPIGNPRSLVSTLPLDLYTSTETTTASVETGAKPIATPAELLAAAGKGDWLTTSLGTVRRKAPVAEQPADLATLRALANETARRAISTHGLRIHRRNAITKVIVSMLAGMTSLWLMLDAGDWRNLQFITACVTLVAAAYWAGQTFCELIETFRFATYDGPEDKLQGFANLPVSNSQADIKN